MSGKKFLFFFVFTAAFLYICPPNSLAENKKSEKNSDIKWKREGELLFRTYQDIIEDNQYENKEALDARLNLNNKLDLKNLDLFFEINTQARYELFVRDNTTKDADLLLRKAYCRLEKENFNLSIGRQVVSWGKLENAAILDLISPQEYNRFILFDKQERKLPVFMVKYEHFWDNFQLESVFLPLFKSSNLSYFGSDWSVYSYLKKGIEEGGEYSETTKSVIRRIRIDEKDKAEEKTLNNSQFGLRLRSKARNIDYGLYYMNLLNSVPSLREKTPNGNTLKKFLNNPTTDNLTELVGLGLSDEDLTLEREHPRVNIFGLDAETVLGEYGARGELGLFFGQPYLRSDYSYVRKNALSAGFGIDHTTSNNLYLNLQFIENYIFNYEPLFPNEKYSHQVNAVLNKDFLRGNLIFNLRHTYNISYHDWMLNPRITYKFKCGLESSLAGFIFEGGPKTDFGKFSTKDLFYIEAIYRF